MTPEEEAYEEALCRIRETETAGALELDLGRLALNRLPRELGLPSLQSLNLTGCGQLSGGLSPLKGLTSLQSTPSVANPHSSDCEQSAQHI
jgi:hypothetical protein